MIQKQKHLEAQLEKIKERLKNHSSKKHKDKAHHGAHQRDMVAAPDWLGIPSQEGNEGGAGFFDSLKDTVKRVASHPAVRKAAKEVGRYAATEGIKSVVGKRYGKQAGDTASNITGSLYDKQMGGSFAGGSFSPYGGALLQKGSAEAKAWGARMQEHRQSHKKVTVSRTRMVKGSPEAAAWGARMKALRDAKKRG